MTKYTQALAWLLTVAVVAAAAAAAAAPSAGYPVSSAVGWCHPDTMFQNLAQENVVREVTGNDAGDQEWRDIMNLPVVPASEITVVQTDSLCMKAGRLINLAFERPVDEQRSIFLIRVGNRRYWAEDHYLHYGGHVYRFIIDSTLTTILSETL